MQCSSGARLIFVVTSAFERGERMGALSFDKFTFCQGQCPESFGGRTARSWQPVTFAAMFTSTDGLLALMMGAAETWEKILSFTSPCVLSGEQYPLADRRWLGTGCNRGLAALLYLSALVSLHQCARETFSWAARPSPWVLMTMPLLLAFVECDAGILWMPRRILSRRALMFWWIFS